MSEDFDSLSQQDKISYIRDLAARSNLDIKETNALVSIITKDSKERYISSEDYTDEFKWTADMSIDALSYMICTHCTIEEALQYVKYKYSKHDDWLGKTRNKPLSNFTKKKSIGAIESIHKDEIEHLIDVAKYRRRSMLRAKTPSQQLTTLSDVITVADRVDNLELIILSQAEELNELRSEVNDLKTRMSYAEMNIINLDNKIKPIDELVAKILELKDTHSIPEIAKLLDVKERKIKYLLYKK